MSTTAIASTPLETRLIQKTLRMPRITGEPGDGAAATRQLDAALLSVGFAASTDLLDHLSGFTPDAVIDAGVRLLGAVRELVGDHVQHNVYFKHFPDGVPEDTVAFWVGCLVQALFGNRGVTVEASIGESGLPPATINLLSLPTYGRYQHTFEEMRAVHRDLVASAKDRVTLVHLGGTLDEEAQDLYLSLAGSRTPLSDLDQDLLGLLAAWCVDGEQPDRVPVREHLALINRVRLAQDRPLVIDTITDVLRLACALSGGDVSLQEPTRFVSLARRDRRAMLTSLNAVIEQNPTRLGDLHQHAEPWKRLVDLLHPEECHHLTSVQDVRPVLYGRKTVRSLAGRFETAMAAGEVATAAVMLARQSPGMYARSLDRILRQASPKQAGQAVHTLAEVVDRISGRVLLSLREHLLNRGAPAPSRLFVNRKRRAWVTDDNRAPLPAEVVGEVGRVIDTEIARRLPAPARLMVDPAVLGVAVPLSGKITADGFGVMPAGSLTPVDGEVLSFFTYWKQRERGTDFDLSALLLDDAFQFAGQVSWTNLRGTGVTYSGDITWAGNGATEVIDVVLSDVDAPCIVPQVHVYSGEGFEEVEESMFGFQVRESEQFGLPVEPRLVRMRSDMRGKGRMSLPMVFLRDGDGKWWAKWTHMYLPEKAQFNRVENTRVSAGLLVRAVAAREYLTIGYLVAQLTAKAVEVLPYGEPVSDDAPVTFIGLEEPEGLPAGSEVFTLRQLNELVPQ